MSSGRIFSIHRLSTDDGPGLRDTFFLKGCLLRCAWCHNPESLSQKPEVWWLERKCIGAKECVQECPKAAMELHPKGITIDRALCDGCGKCVEACPAKAIEFLGKEWTADAVVKEALKERVFYRNSGGGVTLSGGEPTLQAEFVAEVFAKLRAEGVHTALDTCGMNLGRNIGRILPHTDLVLYDLKEMDPAKHLEFTSVPVRPLLDTLLAVRDFSAPTGRAVDIWVRTPLVPGLTATFENISAIGEFLKTQMGPRLSRWDLCAFNNTCSEKYVKLGTTWALKDEPLLDAGLAQELLKTAQSALGDPGKVRLNGLARVPQFGKQFCW